MKFKTLLTINSVLAVVAGIACVLVPAQLLASYGISLVPMGLVIYQFWGAALIGLGMLTWFARNIKESELQKTFALPFLLQTELAVLWPFGVNMRARTLSVGPPLQSIFYWRWVSGPSCL
jgi:hypothetical protein